MTETADPREAGRRQGKSAAAFRTISEVASDLDIPAHVLRFWESKFAQVKPLKRGGGRRYYRPEDIELLRGIRELLYTDGYTIKGVQKLLREGGVKQILAEPSAEAPSTKQDTPADAPPVAAPVEMAVGAAGTAGNGGGSGDNRQEKLRHVLGELEDLRSLLKNTGT